MLGLGVIAYDSLSCFLSSLFHPLSLAGTVEYEVAGLKVSGMLLLGRALCYKRCGLAKLLNPVFRVLLISKITSIVSGIIKSALLQSKALKVVG